MSSRARRIVRDLTPPALTRALTDRRGGRLRFVDGYPTWAAAEAAAGTYSETSILEQVRRATDDVVAGRAVFERDGVTFDEPDYAWPVAAALLWRASLGPLSVLDFGGSLGSSYRQMAPLLDAVDLTWAVVEQPAFVEAGRAYQDERLRFFATIDECAAATRPTVALASGVLQYLPDPYAILADLLACGVDAVIIDRTPFVDGSADLAVVQQVPPEIYAASYPAWMLSHDRLLAAFAGWRVVSEFPTLDAATSTTSGVPIRWGGLLAVRGDG